MGRTKSIQIVGAGGHAKVVVDAWITGGGLLESVADDDTQKSHFLNIPVVRTESLQSMIPVIVTIGDNLTRLKVAKRISNFEFATVVHPQALVSTSAEVGVGTVVLGGAVINPNARVGAHVIVNTGAIVEHDCILEEGVHVAPGAVLCGDVIVGRATLIGAGAVVIPGKKIGSHCIIGAGAVVIHDLPDNVIAVGNPAKIIGENQ
ncbi:MAG: NeuD/PglB/VioB family sugar acetyltransferase [Flammeovirgaceae bacterium]